MRTVDFQSVGVVTELLGHREVVPGDPNTRENVRTPVGSLASLIVSDANAVEDVRPELAGAIPNPPRIAGPNDYHSIFKFGSGSTMSKGEEERAKPEATADFQEVMTVALGSGERVSFPPWLYPIRSLGGPGTGVLIEEDMSIDVECASRATFIAGDVFWALNGYMLNFAAPDGAFNTGDMHSFRWRGGRFDAQQLTADHGMGSGSGPGFMSVSHYHGAFLEDIVFHGGLTTPNTSDIFSVGQGAMDTGVITFHNAMERLHNIRGFGLYDTLYYANGNRNTITLGTNPIATDGTNSATVTSAGHDVEIGDYVTFDGPAVGGVSFDNRSYPCTSVPGVGSFVVNTGANSAATGGTGCLYTNVSKVHSLDTDIKGEDLIMSYCRAYRCGSLAAIKRAFQHYLIADNFARECVIGIESSNVSEPAAHAVRGRILRNFLYKLQFRAIRTRGPVRVQDNRIENLGRYVADPSMVVPIESYAIAVVNAPDWIASGNVVCATPGTPWYEDYASASPALVGLLVTNGTDYPWRSANGRAEGNVFGHVTQPVVEDTTGNANNLFDNTEHDFVTPSSYLGTRTQVRTRHGSQRLMAITEVPPTVVVAGGVIAFTESVIKIACEGAAATDDLDTITAPAGLPIGTLFTIYSNGSSQDVTIKNGTGNIQNAGNADFTLTNVVDSVMFRWNGTSWVGLIAANAG